MQTFRAAAVPVVIVAAEKARGQGWYRKAPARRSWGWDSGSCDGVDRQRRSRATRMREPDSGTAASTSSSRHVVLLRPLPQAHGLESIGTAVQQAVGRQAGSPGGCEPSTRATRLPVRARAGDVSHFPQWLDPETEVTNAQAHQGGTRARRPRGGDRGRCRLPGPGLWVGEAARRAE
jgi:hypothetical protein